MSKKKVVVIGAGLMGSGITQVNLEAGYETTMVDISEEQLNKGKETIEKFLSRNVEKGRMTEQEKDDAIARLTLSTNYEPIKNADVVIEAVTEDLELKKKVFSQIDEYATEDTYLATNTSALSIAAISSVLTHPKNFVGLHFFYPVPVLELVEVTPSILTDESTTEFFTNYSKNINKKPVICNDYAGFIVNRLLIPMVNEAAYLVMEGVKPEDVDAAMKLGANHKMGPLELADFVGIETLVATMEGIYEGFSDSKYRPCPLLVRMVEAGTWGRKTGKGFYNYETT